MGLSGVSKTGVAMVTGTEFGKAGRFPVSARRSSRSGSGQALAKPRRSRCRRDARRVRGRDRLWQSRDASRCRRDARRVRGRDRLWQSCDASWCWRDARRVRDRLWQSRDASRCWRDARRVRDRLWQNHDASRCRRDARRVRDRDRLWQSRDASRCRRNARCVRSGRLEMIAGSRRFQSRLLHLRLRRRVTLIGVAVALASDCGPGGDAACTLTEVASATVSVLVARGAGWSNEERIPLALAITPIAIATSPMRTVTRNLAARSNRPHT